MRPIVFFAFFLCASSINAQDQKYDWKRHKAQLAQAHQIADRFIGAYKRGEGETVEFSISKSSKYDWFRVRFIGTGKFDYEFAASDIAFQPDGEICFRIKGKLYKAKRIDESLELTFPDGKKKYCPRLADAANAQKIASQTR